MSKKERKEIKEIVTRNLVDVKGGIEGCVTGENHVCPKNSLRNLSTKLASLRVVEMK